MTDTIKITAGYLKKYLSTFDETDFDNAVGSDLYSYLGSWGMIRNSVMGKYNYKMFNIVIDIIFHPEYKNLWYLDDKLREFYIKYHVDLDSFIKMANNTALSTVIPIFNSELDEIVELIYNLGEDIRKSLDRYANAAGKKVTDTFITKLMLGTLGCMPGFDTYFKIGIDFSKRGGGDFFEKRYIKVVLLIAIINLNTLVYSQNYIKDSKYQYPFMKLLDIYYFEKGK